MSHIQQRLTNIRERISAAEVRYHRDLGSVKLVAASKSQSIENIREAIVAGQRCFGENYVTEALIKIKALQEYRLEWHFIGAIQSNKTQHIAEHFDWVHSICRDKAAMRLSEQRPAHLPPLNVCIQVNVDNDSKKQGVTLTQLVSLAEKVLKLPHLKLRGLMTMPSLNGHTDPTVPFRTLRMAKEYLQGMGLELDTLSMGMSNDFERAIAEGATIVRVGTALFGERGT